jgi:hypothetical protein
MRRISTTFAIGLSLGVAGASLAAPAFAQTTTTQQNAATAGGDSGPVGGKGMSAQPPSSVPVQAQVPASSNSQKQTDGRAQAGGGAR